MKKMVACAMSLLFLLPCFSFATEKTKMICGEVKQTLKYKAPKKNIQYRYAIIEEYDTFNDEDAYDRQLPYGLYMFKIDPKVKQLHNCFEIDMQKRIILSSVAGG